MIKFPFVNIASSSNTMIPEYHRTDNTRPPEFPEKKPTFGSYCIRSQTDLIDTNNGESMYCFKGYDTDLNISERVKGYCERRLKNKNDKNDKRYVCTEPQVTFIHNKKGCDGTIVIFDNVNATMTTIPPP